MHVGEQVLSATECNVVIREKQIVALCLLAI